jgi:hypothetical protein
VSLSGAGKIKIHAIEAYQDTDDDNDGDDDDDDDDDELVIERKPAAAVADDDDDDESDDDDDDASASASQEVQTKTLQQPHVEKQPQDMTIHEPDEAYGQYDWATLEAELGMPAASAGAKAAPAKPTSVPPSKALSASEVLDDVGGDDGDDSEIQRMQAELEATGRGTLQGVDILATLAALEAPDEQIEAQSDDEDDDAKKAVRTASQSKASVVARASTAGSDDSSDEDDDDDGDANAGAQRADLEKLDSAALVALVLKERARANEAKKTIGSLIEQITEYQSAMEEEKAELEKRVKETLAECAALEQLQEKRESEISAFFEKKIDALVSEVEQEKRANSKLSNETISNLQTLMVELQNIEAVNSRLNQELADEREQHARAPLAARRCAGVEQVGGR